MTITPCSALARACVCLVAGIFAMPAVAQSITGRDSVPLPTRERILDNEYLRNALSRSARGLEVIRHGDGTLTVDLQGRFQSISAARLGADGRIETICTARHETLADYLAAHPGSTPPVDARAGVDE
jgi:hypothetical protein